MTPDLRQRVEALQPKFIHGLSSKEDTHFGGGYDQCKADVLALLDEQVTRDLEEAGIDMQPAFDRLHAMIEKHRTTHTTPRGEAT